MVNRSSKYLLLLNSMLATLGSCLADVTGSFLPSLTWAQTTSQCSIRYCSTQVHQKLITVGDFVPRKEARSERRKK